MGNPLRDIKMNSENIRTCEIEVRENWLGQDKMGWNKMNNKMGWKIKWTIKWGEK